VFDLATVSINGKRFGVLWNPPFVADITQFLKDGANSIEVSVTNTWHNLLVGDEQFPADFEWGVDRGENGRMMKSYPDWFINKQPRTEKIEKVLLFGTTIEKIPLYCLPGWLAQFT